jgi:hypothetical protein
MIKYLVKHFSIESGKVWWFLDEVVDFQYFEWCRSKTMLKMLKDIKCARFIKRYDSEEELNIDADLMFGKCEMKCV